MTASTNANISIEPVLSSPSHESPVIIGGESSPARTTKAAASQMKSEHLGSSRQYWRDIILGVNDGLVSTFLLVAGVSGGGMTSNAILLTAVAGALAGAISMMAGEFVATKSQNEVMLGELKLERTHVESYLDEELSELSDLLELIGLPPAANSTCNDGDGNRCTLRDQLLAYYRENPEALFKIMTTLEFGVLDTEMRSPIVAGLSSCGLFIGGSLPSVIPFIFSGDEPLMGLMYAAVCTTLTLLLVGAVKTWATRGKCLHSAIENLVIAGCGAVVAYYVGDFFDSVIGQD